MKICCVKTADLHVTSGKVTKSAFTESGRLELAVILMKATKPKKNCGQNLRLDF